MTPQLLYDINNNTPRHNIYHLFFPIFLFLFYLVIQISPFLAAPGIFSAVTSQAVTPSLIFSETLGYSLS